MRGWKILGIALSSLAAGVALAQQLPSLEWGRVTLVGSDGATQAGTSSNPLTTTGGIQYAEDTVAAGGDLVTLAGTYRFDTPLASAGNLDRTVLITGPSGQLWTGLINGTTAVGTSNPLPVQEQTATGITLSNVSVAASSFTIAAANSARLSLECCNTGLATINVSKGTTPAVLDQTSTVILPGACWRDEPPVYTGAVYGIGDQADGALYCEQKTR